MKLAHELELKLNTVFFPRYTLRTIGHMLVAFKFEREYLKSLKKFYRSMRDKYMPILSHNLQCFDTEVKRLNDEQQNR